MSELDEFRKWNATRPQDAMPATPRKVAAPPTETDQFRDWQNARRGEAATRATAMIERSKMTGYTPDQASSDVKLSDELARNGGPQIAPEMMEGVHDELTNRLNAQRTQAQLMGSTKLAGWVSSSPVNAALAERDLQNLSALSAVIDSAMKSGERSYTSVDKRVRTTWYETKLDKALQTKADSSRTLAEIYAAEGSNDVMVVPGISQAQQAIENVAFTMSRYLGSRARSAMFDPAEIDAKIEERREDFSAALGREIDAADAIEQKYGRTASRAVLDEKVAAIKDVEGGWEQTQAFADLMAEDLLAMSGWLAFTVVESAAPMAGAIGVKIATGSTAAAAATMGLMSGSIATSMNYAEQVQDGGYDMRDPAQRLAFVNSPEVRRSIRDKAYTYGLVVGLMDAASGGVAGTKLASNAAGNLVLQALAQAAMGAGGEYLGKLASGQEIDMVDVIVEGLAEMVTAPLEVVGVGGRKLGRARAVRQDRALFEALAGNAEGSQMRKTAPKKYRELVAALTKDGPVETLYVDAQALDQMFQSSTGVTVEQFLGALPGVDIAEFREARDRGGVVSIPTSSYATDIVGTPIDVALRAHLKTSPEHMSRAELDEYRDRLDELTKQAQSAADRAESGMTEMEREAGAAYTDLVSSLRKTGSTADAARFKAAQAVAFARTTAQRLGIPLGEFLKTYPLADVQSALDTAPGTRAPRVTAEAVARAARPRQDPLGLVTRGTRLLHGTQTRGVTLEGIEIVRTGGQKQGKKGRVYGGFYATAADDMAQARGYAGDGGSVLEIALRDGVRILRKEGDITRLSEKDIEGWVAQGYGLVVGKDPRGNTEYVVIDKNAIESVSESAGGQDLSDVIREAAEATGLDLTTADPLEVERAVEQTFGPAAGPALMNQMSATGAPKVYDVAAIEARAAELAATMQPLDGTPKVAGATGPDFYLVAVAEAYAEQNGVRYARQAEFVEVDVERAQAIAAAYDAMEHRPTDADVLNAYKQLIEQTTAQYEALVAAGYQFWFMDPANDPYGGNPWGAMRDLRATKRMAVFPTDDGYGSGATELDASDNPLLVDTGLMWAYGSPTGEQRRVTANDLFRAVHDAFGHGLEGAGFRARGEENAWQAHVRMFKGWAVQALTTETRGQNSWLNYGPHGDKNRTAKVEDTVFADQKAGLMPVWTSEQGIAENEVPTLPLNEDGTVTLTHWSNRQRATLKPSKAGTGPLTGAERNRRGPDKTFYGVGVGMPGGYQKENLGPFRHEVRVQPTDLYDLTADADGIVAAIPDTVGAFERTGWVEEQIAAKGFKGYVVREGAQGVAAALFDDAVPTRVTDDRAQTFFQSGAEPDFFSALTREVENAKQKSAMAKDWLAIISKLPGIKKAEITWSGVEAWLGSQEGQVKREDVAAFLRNNEVEIETILLSGEEADSDSDGTNGIAGYSASLDNDGRQIEEDDDYLRENGWDAYGEELVDDKLAQLNDEADDGADELMSESDLDASTMEELRETAYERALADYNNDPNYEYDVSLEFADGSSEYETIQRYGGDGGFNWNGEDYRSLQDAYEAIVENYEERARDAAASEGMGQEATRFSEWTEKGGTEYEEVLVTVPRLHATGLNVGRNATPFVKELHFKQENIVMHARVNRRKAANGDNVFFVEEAQGDLPSYWRDLGGFTPRDPVLYAAKVAAYEAALVDTRAAQSAVLAAADALDVTIRARAEAAGVALPENVSTVRFRALKSLRLGTRPDTTDGDNPVFDKALEWLVVDIADPAYHEQADTLELAQEENVRLSDIYDAARDAEREARNSAGNSTPATPFEGEASYALIMRKLMKMAAEQGADRLAWTPAYMQARRWSGAVQNVVQEITWAASTYDGAADGTRALVNERDQAFIDMNRARARLVDDLRGDVVRRGGASQEITSSQDKSEELFDMLYDNDGDVVSVNDPAGLELDDPTWATSAVVFAAALRERLAGPSGAALENAMAKVREKMAALAEARAVPPVAVRAVELVGVNGSDTLKVDDSGIVVWASGNRIPSDQVVGKKLSEVLGGTMARRVVEEEAGEITGENIVVGGEGYKIAYDQQMKKFVEKFAKQYGGRVVVDKTMPDFVRATNSDPAVRVAARFGFAATLERLRASGVRDDAFWTRFSATEKERGVATMQRLEQIQMDDTAAYAAFTPEQKASAGGVLFLAEMTRRAEVMADFETAESAAQRAYKRLVSEGFVTDKQVFDALPEELRPQGEAVWSVTITEELREAARQAQPLFQKRPDGARGSILLPTDPGRAPLITLFPKANLSTFLHESGHYYLHILQDLAKRGTMPEQMAADWDTTLAWWRDNIDGIAKDGGVTADQVRMYMERGTTGDIDVDQKVNVGMHEQWARAYEAYAMEGKSPSNALRSAFEAFGAWMLSIYKQAKNLNVEINDELRGVFDRLLATDEEIALAARDNGFDKLVAESAAALGISDVEYQTLVRMAGDAQDEAKQQLLGAIMAPLRREKTEAFRAERKEVEAEVAEKVNAKPAHRVREWLGNERWIGADNDVDPNPSKLPLDLRMNRRLLIEEYGQEMVNALPRGSRPLTTMDTSRTADEVSGWFGYKSGSEMLQDLISTPKAADEIKSRTDAEMRKRHGDPLSDGTIEAEAVAALHGDKRGMLLAAELRAIGKTAKQGKPTTRGQAAAIARATIRRMPVRLAVRSGQYLAAERRSGERAVLAVARGNMDEAFAAKREQLLNHMLFVESRKADEILGKIERRVAKLKKKSVRDNLAGEYLEAIDEILTSYDFRKSTTQRDAQRRGGLLRYVEMMKEAGRENELAIPAYVMDEARRRPYKTVPVNELEGVLDSLRNIEHTARMKKKLRDAQNERELTAVVDGIVAEMDANLPDKPQNRVATPGDRARRGAREFANLLLNTDTILRKIGGFTRGEAYDAIKEPVDMAANWAAVERTKAAEAFEALYATYDKKTQRRMAVRTHYPELKGAFTKWDLISAALNMGNADNMARLMDKDSGQGFNASQVQFIKDQMTKQDWDFVQASWDMINGYWPLIEARERRVSGVAPKKVEATEVETPFGVYAGGYYPIKYRGDVSGLVASEEMAETQKRMMAGRFGKAQTRNGHLEERALGSGGRVLQLGIEVMHGHIGQVIHDLAFSEVVANTNRLLQDVRIRTSFERKGLLADHQALELWLQDTAVGQMSAGGVFGRLALRAKNGFTLSKLAFNLSTVAIQLTGITQSIAVVGSKNMAYGYSTYLSNPKRTSEEVVGFSPFMAERETTFNRDINDILGDVAIGPMSSRVQRFQQALARVGFWLMQKVQFYGVDVPTWYGGYKQGMDLGFNEQKARQHADRMVARAQASGVFSDRSAFERGTLSHDTRQNGFVRLFTTLGSYMFAKGNIAYEVYGRTARDMDGVNLKTLTAAIRGAVDMALLFTIEAIAYNLIKGTLPGMGDDDDEEKWGEFLAKQTALSMMSTIPGIRDAASTFSGFDAGAYGSILGTFTKPLIQLGNEETSDIALFKAISSAVGVVTGAPSGQLNRIADAWYRLEEGEDVSPVEFIMGRR